LVANADELIGRNYHAPSSSALVWRGNVSVPSDGAEKNLVVAEERLFWVLSDLELECGIDHCDTFSIVEEKLLKM
jgi:hypothetical protein